MSLGFFSFENSLAEYSDIWVSLKVENAYFIFQGEMLETDEWVNFHFTQTSDGVWATEVMIEGKVYKTVFDYDVLLKRLREQAFLSRWSSILRDTDCAAISILTKLPQLMQQHWRTTTL